MSKAIKFIKSKGLEKEFEKFKKVKWSIESNFLYSLCLYKNKKCVSELALSNHFTIGIFYHLIYKIACSMNCVVSKEQFYNIKELKYGVYYCPDQKKWDITMTYNAIHNSDIIDTLENAITIKKLLNNSKAVKKWIESK